ncbi:armadillo-type protein [Dunaliella salina]|uniref:AP-2 complex subunit alpha n=1 Tax=Dunaliella salina TaxID=3046 RepID=A0ABQ7G0D5_DUNSA|nr:armadillo-type protein [Dunaliella salina]|eukprot:KAF5828063.1 armadillo-type protein [Dunaliella salina]
MSKIAYMKGLKNFIDDIRGSKNKEEEERRIDKELAKIRSKFADDKSLNGYDRRKYVWKLLYIYMLGYDIEFGHKQAADLIPLTKYKDKQVGYMACSLLLHENDEFLRLAINAIHMDLISRNEAFETLALSFIGNAGYEAAQPRLIKVLERLTVHRTTEVPPEYLYYGIPTPWLQCKCMRVLQFFPLPEKESESTLLTTIVKSTIESIGGGDSARSANPNKANALYSILFEAIALAIHLDTDRTLLNTCVAVLGKFLMTKEPNAKYLALETLARLALIPEILEAIRGHQPTITASLKVEADYSMREELVLKIAILAEKFAPSVQWYVDVVLRLLEKAGDFVSDDIWHRVVQLVTNNHTMQQYAARNIVESLRRGAQDESLICTAAYILGEFGRLIVDEVPPMEQFQLLHGAFPQATPLTKGLLMTAFIKIYLLDAGNPKFRETIMNLFSRHQTLMDAELQQRASEYLQLANNPQTAAQYYLLPMPKWEERESTLLRRLQQQEGTDADTAGVPQANPPPALTTTPSGHQVESVPSYSVQGTTSLVVGGPLEQQQQQQQVMQQQQQQQQQQQLAAVQPGWQAAPGLPGAPSYGQPAGYANAFSAPVNPYQQPQQPYLPQPQLQPQQSLSFAPPQASLPAQGFGPPPSLPSPANPFEQPFGDDSAFGPPAFQQQLPQPQSLPDFEPAQPIGSIDAWFANLLIKDKGVLYEDQYLQVGVQSMYLNGAGQVTLYLGNKHAGAAVQALAIRATPPAGLQVQVAPVPVMLAPKQQVQVAVQVMAMMPFQGAPDLLLDYKMGNTIVHQDLRLPVLPHKFVIPEPAISKELFFSQWKANSIPPNKAQEMVERATPLTTEIVTATARLANLGVEHGYLDPSPYNEAGAGYFVYGMPGAQQSILVMARIEGNPATMAQFRVTLASQAPQLSMQLKDLLAQHIRSA